MTLSLYLSRFISIRFVMAWFALAILGISLDLFQAANDIIPLGGAPRLLEYVIFRTPQILITLFPVAILIGATVAFLSLGNNQEVIILRAAGCGIFVILLRLIPLGILLGLLYSQAGDRINSWTAEKLALSFPEIRNEAPVGSWMWARDGSNIIRARVGNEDGTLLHELTVYETNASGHISARLTAERATYDGNQWSLSKGEKIQPDEKQAEEPQVWSTLLSPDSVREIASKSVDVSAKDARDALLGNAVTTRSASYYATRIARSYSAIALPFAILMFAALAGLGGTRNDSGLRLAAYSLILGFCYIVVDGMFGSLGETGIMPPSIAAATPTLMFIIVGVWGLVILDE